MSKINDFPTNKQESIEKELHYLSQLYLHLASPSGSYMFAHGESEWAQSLQQHGVDVEVRRGRESIWYDDKIVNWPTKPGKDGIIRPYEWLCFETLSCSKPGKETEGWMHTGRADRLTYGFEQQLSDIPTFLDTYVIPDFPHLKKWFWGLDLTRYVIHTEEEGNRTRSVLIPILAVLEAFPDTQRYLIFESRMIPVMKEKKTPIARLVPLIRKFIMNGEVGA